MSSTSGSGSEEEEAPPAFTTMSRTDLKNALHTQQIRNEKLSREMKELRQELATLKAAPTRGVQPGADSSKKPPKRTSALPPDIQDNVKNLAKKWCVLHDPWIPSDAFMKPPADNLDVDVDVNSAERYQNQEEYTAGLVNELHVYLSTEKLRKLAMKTRAFSADFLHHVSQERSTAVNGIRGIAEFIVSELPGSIPPDLLASGRQVARKRNDDIQALLSFPNDDTQIFPPLCYPSLIPSTGTFLQCSVLAMILRFLLFSKSSINGGKIAGNTVGKKWGVTSLTPGAIALAPVLLAYVLSDDTELLPIGGKTGFKYKRLFYKIKKQLVLGHGTSVVRKIYRYYHQIVFAGLDFPERGVRTAANETEEEAGLAAMLASMDLASDDGEDGERGGAAMDGNISSSEERDGEGGEGEEGEEGEEDSDDRDEQAGPPAPTRRLRFGRNTVTFISPVHSGAEDSENSDQPPAANAGASVKKKRQSRREAASEQVHNPGPTVTTRGSKRARSTS